MNRTEGWGPCPGAAICNQGDRRGSDSLSDIELKRIRNEVFEFFAKADALINNAHCGSDVWAFLSPDVRDLSDGLSNKLGKAMLESPRFVDGHRYSERMRTGASNWPVCG
jgi:hypothetical protein